VSSLVDSFLKSPLSGLAPWIVLSVLIAPGRFEEASAAALGIAVLVLWLSRRRGIAIHLLEWFGVVVFVVYAVLGLVAPHSLISFLELWGGEITNILLALFAFTTLLIRRPFTLAYAKDETPQEYWDSPVFLRINVVITAAWAAAFAVNAVVGAIGDAVLHDSGNFWTGWVLQLAAIFAVVAFTDWYPEHATGEAPSVGRLLDWLPTFVLVVGIYGWVADTVPAPVGIGMIIAGSAGAAVLKKVFPDRPG
jgi:hypothetical protein